MTFSRRLRRFAALAALSGIALQALWPAIVQARPANSISVPLCSVDGARHEIELPLGNKQSDKGAEHCKLCVLGTDKPVVSNAQLAFVSSAETCLGVFEEEKPSCLSSRTVTAHPRAPPIAS